MIEAHAHPSTPPGALVPLVFGKPEPMGVSRFLRHPNFPVERLAELAAGRPDHRELAASHPALDPVRIIALTRDRVRRVAGPPPATPPSPSPTCTPCSPGPVADPATLPW